MALVVLRIVWIFPGAVSAAADSVGAAGESRGRAAQQVLLVGWMGMRGRGVAGGGAGDSNASGRMARRLPARDLVLFLTFAVILVTLVGQSLTLPAVIRILRHGSAGGGPVR